MIEEVGGGMLGGKKLKAVIPGGSSCPLLTADEIDVTMDYDSVAKIGSMLGSGGVVVIDEDTCMVELARPHHAFLRARILRLVHSLPRRHGLAARCSTASTPAAGCAEDIPMVGAGVQHAGQNVLPAGRCRGHADHQHREKIPARVRRAPFGKLSVQSRPMYDGRWMPLKRIPAIKMADSQQTSR